MFCSTCKRIEIELNEDVRRKICDFGHILCNICDKDFDDCKICSSKFRNIIFIEVKDKVPRLQILSIEDDDSDGEKMKIPENQIKTIHQNTPVDSVKDLSEQLKKYGMACETNKDENDEHPTIGCFQVISHKKSNHPVSYTISLDDDEEEIIVKNFKVANKKNEKSNQQNLESFPSCGEGDGNSLSVHRPCSTTTFTRTHSLTYSTRSDCMESDAEFSFIDSAFQVYKNERPSLTSMANSNFTSLYPSRMELSPPLNAAKIPTIGHRVKFSPVFECDDKTSPQMEPLGLQCDEEENENGGKVTLSRMPLICPISSCGSSSLPSDFFDHMTNDHPYINIVKMSLFKVANFYICHAGNTVMCHKMFLVEGKLSNIGHGFCEHCVPIIIVSTKLNLQQMFGSTQKPLNQCDEVFCIRPLSVYEYPVKYSLNVWSHGRDDSEPTLIRCISSTVPYLSSQHTFREIFNDSLVISNATLEKLTSKNSLISCQIVFH